MKTSLNKIAIGAVALIIAAAGVSTVSANCFPTPAAISTIDTTTTYPSWLVANPLWGGRGGLGPACGNPDIGCAAIEPGGMNGPPISAGITGIFWALGAGNPTADLGVDSDDYPASEWTRQVTVANFPSFGEVLYNASLTKPSEYVAPGTLGNRTGTPPNWSDSRVDGCIGSLGAGTCECVLLEDSYGDANYFAVLAAPTSDSAGSVNLSSGVGFIRFGNLTPNIIRSARDSGAGTADFDVAAPPLDATNGVYQKDGCNCIVGYQLYGQERAAVGPGAPVDLDPNSPEWMPLITRGGMEVVPAGSPATYDINCDLSTDTEWVFSWRLVLDSGFAAGRLAGPPQLFSCSSTLADPDRPGRRPAEPPRGRGRDNRPSR